MLSGMTRKWLITIVIAIVVILIGVWLYTGYAADEVDPEVAEDEAVSVVVIPEQAPAVPARWTRSVSTPPSA